MSNFSVGQFEIGVYKAFSVIKNKEKDHYNKYFMYIDKIRKGESNEEDIPENENEFCFDRSYRKKGEFKFMLNYKGDVHPNFEFLGTDEEDKKDYYLVKRDCLYIKFKSPVGVFNTKKYEDHLLLNEIREDGVDGIAKGEMLKIYNDIKEFLDEQWDENKDKSKFKFQIPLIFYIHWYSCGYETVEYDCNKGYWGLFNFDSLLKQEEEKKDAKEKAYWEAESDALDEYIQNYMENEENEQFGNVN